MRCKIGYNVDITLKIGYNAMFTMRIAYSMDFFQSQVPRTKRYLLYLAPNKTLSLLGLCEVGKVTCQVLLRNLATVTQGSHMFYKLVLKSHSHFCFQL